MTVGAIAWLPWKIQLKTWTMVLVTLFRWNRHPFIIDDDRLRRQTRLASYRGTLVHGFEISAIEHLGVA